MLKLLFSVVLSVVLLSVANSQEWLAPVLSNPLKAHAETFAIAKTTVSLPLEIPFLDDFSNQGHFPDTRFWADNFVFVNSGFAVHPKTVGVATFDMLDQHGRLYDRASESPFQFVADFLTSHPIRLGHLTPADSVLLTFYFQPQGNGGNPRERDSLVVEFLKTPGRYELNEHGVPVWIPDMWQTVWNTTGETLESFSNNEFPFFKRVAIFISDPVFFRNDFRLRFKNYGSFAPPDQSLQNMAGNNNIWNIDYVFLDRGRSKRNVTYHDIAFAAPAKTLLRRYVAMPWSHFLANSQSHLKTNLENKITNLGGIIYNYTYRYLIRDEQGNTIRTYSGGAWNIAPFSQGGYQVFQPHTSPIVVSNPFPGTQAEKRQFQIIHVIREGVNGDSNRQNDTIVFNQVFGNFFAYDDGTPESGYGLIGRNARGAYRFILSRADTLRAIQFFFNRTIENQNAFPVRIMVWSSLQPEQVLYQSASFTPHFSDDLNGFITYELSNPVQVSGTIFIGWEQRTEGFINLGYDANSPAGENIFFNVGNGWQPSIYPGALMIRPVVASSQASVTTGEVLPPDEPGVFPNPLKESMLNIVMDQSVVVHADYLWVEVFDMTGRQVLAREFNPVINLGHLLNGIYLLRITNRKDNTSQTTRFIIAR
ncbi:MAG TPA: T9SS type A sorting domain-containing protein [Bacteroidales bacterium]|nr:T9SS type A sorting domain-containing protein [Bacteroidales bacterium]